MARVKIYTTDSCPYCVKAKNILGSKGIEYEEINIHGNEELRDEIEKLTGRRDVPQIFIDGSHIGDDDDLEELRVSGELDKMFSVETQNDNGSEIRNVIIIGSGPAGFAAALYAARASLKPLVITGNEIGGQVAKTNDIENYPGFQGESPTELMKIMQEQAERFGAEIRFDMVTEVDFEQHPFKITTYDLKILAKSVIIATGASRRKLKVPGEEEFSGRGVSYCATCDGFFFQNRTIVVVGGSDAAAKETLFLTRFASEVHLIHRRDRLRSGAIFQEHLFNNEKVDIVWDSIVEEIQGDENGVTAVRLKNVKTSEQTIHPTKGVFIAIGVVPNTEIFQGKLELNENGYIITDHRQRTNVPGVFAAGDVQDQIYRQAIMAAGTGAAAAVEAEEYIAEIEHRAYPGR